MALLINVYALMYFSYNCFQLYFTYGQVDLNVVNILLPFIQFIILEFRTQTPTPQETAHFSCYYGKFIS